MTLLLHPARPGCSKLAIAGVAGRLPGADNELEFWRLLDEGRCSVGTLPAGRWRPERYYHPRASEPGFSYSFAGGYIDDPLGFDPAVFGISPREAAEMDPQQRLLLEVVWLALENAGIPPSALAGSNVGVYVGGSSLDYGNLHTTDPAAVESHFMTGNTLSILSNRISYIFDLRGPSFTIDTACSSSLVAFAAAQAAISSGRIDMAIVAGVNLLMSPTSFVGFSRASMLSPTGLCRPFSAQADGYVRAEGAVAMLLVRLETAVAHGYPVRAVALASGVNSDGRTSGISLPSREGQRDLLDRLYRQGEIDPRQLAFVEAHGTGTRVGDPAEAVAIGEALGQMRSAPLPLGSVKSNIGHLEPASGLAGLYKAILALEHRTLPRSLHADDLNPAIDFGALNLVVASDAVTLPPTGTWLAGISSFGFGGTNAHAVIRHPEPAELPARDGTEAPSRPELLVLSAYSRQALAATAADYAAFIEAGSADGNAGFAAEAAAATAWQRDLAGHRLAVPLSDPAQMAASLRGFAQTGSIAEGAAAVAPSGAPKLCFAFSGNGSQWAGMGRTAFARNAAFARRFRAIDALFVPLSGWSLAEALHDPSLADRLGLTRVAQPLLFAVQSALVASLSEWGMKPDMVLGHSVGEVAAAEACGAIGLADAVHIIFHRSAYQQKVHGLGTMAVASLSRHEAEALIGGSGLAGLEIAAVNSPTSVTISGPGDAVAGLAQIARKRRVALRVLDLAYPFHSAILEPLRLPLLDALGVVATREGGIPFVSTVSGGVLAGHELDGTYWWRNVRDAVLFRDAVEAAARLGASIFVEIGPRPILTSNIADTLREAGLDGTAMPSLLEREGKGAADPLILIAARALVMGCRLDTGRLFGARPPGRLPLPSYAWQRKVLRQPPTSEALDLYGSALRHPLIGARLAQGTPEWRTLIDATVVPYLGDHRIDDEVVIPGSALAEMALAVAREVFPEGPIGLEDFDLLQWLPLPQDAMREISVRLSGDTRVVEVWSRPRLAADEWTLHARGRIVKIVSPAPACTPRRALPHALTEADVYGAAAAAGIQYGPAFRRVLHAERDDKTIEVVLSPLAGDAGLSSRGHVLHPTALDASFHALFENIKPRLDERYAYLPVRFGSLRVDIDDAQPARAHVVVDRETDNSIVISVTLYDAQSRFIASLSGGLFRAVVLDRRQPAQVFYQQRHVRLSRKAGAGSAHATAAAALAGFGPEALPDSWLMLEGFARALAHRDLRRLVGDSPMLPEAPATFASLAAGALPLALSLLEHLHAAGLAAETPDGWMLAGDSGLPDPAEILQTFAAEYSGATAEIVLAAQALTGLEGALRTGTPVPVRTSIWEQFESCSLLFAPVLAAACRICDALAAPIRPDPLRVLVAEPSCRGLLRMLIPLVRAGSATVAVIGTDGKRLRAIAAQHASAADFEFIEIEDDADLPGEALFDLALGFAFGPVFGDDLALGRAIARRVSPAGLICVLQPPDNSVFDLLLGTSERWFAASSDLRYPVGRVAAAQTGARGLVAAGFGDVESIVAGEGAGSILLASPQQRPLQPGVGSSLAVLVGDQSALAVQLARQLREDGYTVQVPESGTPASYGPAWGAAAASIGAGEVVDVVFAGFAEAAGGLDRSLAHLAALVEVVQGAPCRLWVLVRGLGQTGSGVVDPIAEAVWCFGRVAMNEYPSLALRLIDAAPELDPDLAARDVAELIAHPGPHAELLVDRQGAAAVRVVRGARQAAEAGAPAARLQLGSKGVLGSFDWAEIARRPPDALEVEVEIVAAGLNFRDIMLATGLLDDDVLDDGLAGAVFGFECAGRVVRVGAQVTGLRPGDAVMGFGRQSFATHCSADARVFTRLPDGVPVEAAATIPVAFLTAWYALVHLAQLQAGEWVLIHGAAGGVGLAAMQIARLRGARIAATVGSPDKRAVVELFGAEKVFNSRSTAFRDDVAREIGGVDVVLNSLAGDAMLASLKCLKPFGRFVELGKRDYVLNTAIGLRPFRRNLTYYGVDLDQLLAANLPLANRLMGDLVQHFESGALTPLPHRAFAWHEAGEAFHLMQAAGHVGKVLVRPSAEHVAAARLPTPFRPGPGVHLVIGGAGGLGFETAAWLAEKGAEIVVVASRRGGIEPHLQERADAIRAGGCRLMVQALDVSDAAAVDALIARLVQAHGRLAGVIHAAMVLDDGLIARLEPTRTRAVLAPKVDGAANLDRATRKAALDYFVVYSSATTMIGNPGQAAYVAANGYLQGLVRRRRQEGLPGLAVAWGAIADVGALARNPEVAAKLERISGFAAMRAAEALSHLEFLLARPAAFPSTVTCARFVPGAAFETLRLLNTPAFADLFAVAGGTDRELGVDLAALVAGKSDAAARTAVAGLVALEVAGILRVAAEDIDVARPLDEVGMDSLMSLELRMGVEKRFGVELPIVAIGSGVTVNDLAARLIAGMKDGAPGRTGEAEMSLLQRHGASHADLAETLAAAEAADLRPDAVIAR